MAMSGFLAVDFDSPTRLQPLKGAQWCGRSRPVFIKREDERDPLLGGNKWCKLLGHLAAAQAAGCRHLLSVGGPWSNHLHALAHAGARYGFATTGIVRGEPCETAMLAEARAAGMQLHFVSRSFYRQRQTIEVQAALRAFAPDAWLIPEGGAGAAAEPGLALLARELAAQTAGPVELVLPVGSGTTLAGIVRHLPSRFRVTGVMAFHDPGLPARLATALTGSAVAWRLLPGAAMRRHAVLPQALARLHQAFQEDEGVLLDTVYGVRTLAALPACRGDGALVMLHTGGLQGSRGHLPVRAAA